MTCVMCGIMCDSVAVPARCNFAVTAKVKI